jgi:hypothetical protein
MGVHIYCLFINANKQRIEKLLQKMIWLYMEDNKGGYYASI